MRQLLSSDTLVWQSAARHSSPWLWCAGLGAWLTVVALGFYWLDQRQFTPGTRGVEAPVWPVESTLQRSSGQPTLVLALHPRCPCSRATLQVLTQLLARYPGQATAKVLVCVPEQGWEDGQDALADCRTMLPPAAEVVIDPQGREARRFGAATSGHIFLYGADGRLVFSGGITRGRGQNGDSPGSVALGDRLQGSSTSPMYLEVFGCPLHTCE